MCLQNAVGFIPDRVTDSRAGSQENSQLSTKGGVMRSLKEFVQTTVRLLDRNGLRTYLQVS